MKKLAVLFLASVVGLMAADVSGNWKGTVQSQFGTSTRTFTFKVDGSKLTGKTSSDMTGDSTIEDGKIAGDELTFTVNASVQGNDISIAYKGHVVDAEVTGYDQKIEYTVQRVK